MFVALLSRFAEDSPTVHIAPITLTTFHGFPITNSMVFGWLCSFIIIVSLIVIARTMTIMPKGGFTQLVEVGTDFVSNLLAGALNSPKKAKKYAPYFAAIFFFIMFSNLLGLLPGVGEALTVHGEPAFRPFTADLNGTLAAATLSIVMVQVFAVRESGFTKHLRHYFQGKLWNPATYLIGLYEIFGELIRLFSLALRLFLNITIGEIIISIFAFLGRYAGPVTAFPFLLLEIGVCVLQAYIFVMLCTTYLAVSIHHGEEHEEEDQEPPLELVMTEGRG